MLFLQCCQLCVFKYALPTQGYVILKMLRHLKLTCVFSVTSVISCKLWVNRRGFFSCPKAN